MSFMLLGILNSQAAGGGAGAYDLLETTTLTSSASSVTFSGLGSYSNYAHLQVRYTMRLDSAFDGGTLLYRLNSDSGSNYARHQLIGSGSSVLSQASTTFNQAGYGIGGGAPANIFGTGVIDFLDFSSTAKNTTLRSLSGRVGAADSILLTSSLWNNTAAVTSLELYASNDLVSGCRFSLYGIKGA